MCFAGVKCCTPSMHWNHFASQAQDSEMICVLDSRRYLHVDQEGMFLGSSKLESLSWTSWRLHNVLSQYFSPLPETEYMRMQLHMLSAFRMYYGMQSIEQSM
mmetsp:Transcript_1929/g.2945  ORF Transcript_1929/g.2945 Transcript_1929/m.2945 type:complete len:102 (+) Transcript_1929:76-381(+)